MAIIKALYINLRFFFLLGMVILCFILGFSFPLLFDTGMILLVLLGSLVLIDGLLLFSRSKGVDGERKCSERFSNGDNNNVEIALENYHPFPVSLTVIDEIPLQFQIRDFQKPVNLSSREKTSFSYQLRPVERGIYQFGNVNIFVNTTLGLLARRYKIDQHREIKVYPSFIQMRKYELLAISNNLQEYGLKRVRRIGHNQEFEQIREYVKGDDFRSVNWKATARRNKLMVNNYQQERSQQVFALLDKGRMMKMPFEGMTLLDYAINAALVITNIILRKDDKAGLITFQHKVEDIVPASRRNRQLITIMETLYHQDTSFLETDFSKLYGYVRKHINRHALLLVFTNFESYSSMERQLPYLRKMAHNHLVVCILFKNATLEELMDKEATSVEEVYEKVVAEKFAHEKRLIMETLRQYGIHTILTRPRDLNVETINKYLELKQRGLVVN